MVRRIADSRFGVRSRDAHGQRICEGMIQRSSTWWTARWTAAPRAVRLGCPGCIPRSVFPYFANAPLPSAFSLMYRMVSKMVSLASRGAKPSSLLALVLSKYQK